MLFLIINRLSIWSCTTLSTLLSKTSQSFLVCGIRGQLLVHPNNFAGFKIGNSGPQQGLPQKDVHSLGFDFRHHFVENPQNFLGLLMNQGDVIRTVSHCQLKTPISLKAFFASCGTYSGAPDGGSEQGINCPKCGLKRCWFNLQANRALACVHQQHFAKDCLQKSCVFRAFLTAIPYLYMHYQRHCGRKNANWDISGKGPIVAQHKFPSEMIVQEHRAQ